MGFHDKQLDLFNNETLWMGLSALMSYKIKHLSIEVPHIKLLSAGEYFKNETVSTPQLNFSIGLALSYSQT